MTKTIPCYRVLYWDTSAQRYFPLVTRTRNLLKTLRQAKRNGLKRKHLWIDLRPGKGIPLPFPTKLKIHRPKRTA